MVVIVSREGQLANRMLHASSFIANAQEHQYRVIHLFFDEYYSFFSESLGRKDTAIRFLCKRKGGLAKFFQKMIALSVKALMKLKITRLPFFEIIKYEGYEQESIPFNLNNEDFLQKAKSKLVLVHGWLFRDYENQKKYRNLLLNTWTPDKKYQDNTQEYYNKYKKNQDILIGVHIRGGDYKKFEGGKWYYTTEQYYGKMKEVAALNIFCKKKLAFIICTNEKNILFPDAQNFSVFNEERHFIEDIYLLAKCDYIMGPPSTFSMWASFYGAVPLYMLRNINLTLDDNSFRPEIIDW